jgi:hypothetical protein
VRSALITQLEAHPNLLLVPGELLLVQLEAGAATARLDHQARLFDRPHLRDAVAVQLAPAQRLSMAA